MLSIVGLFKKLGDVAGIGDDLCRIEIDFTLQELGVGLARIHGECEGLLLGQIFQPSQTTFPMNHDTARTVLNGAHHHHDIRLLGSGQENLVGIIDTEGDFSFRHIRNDGNFGTTGSDGDV